jgi:signal transduction histidine kinase/CheY-like chemotaxis protein
MVMRSRQNSLAADQLSSIRIDLRDLQRESILLVIPGMFLAAVLLLAIEQLTGWSTNYIPAANALLALSAAVWLLRLRSYLATAWTMVIGLVSIIVLIVVMGKMSAAMTLLVFPVGLAALYVNLQAGAGVAVGCSALLLLLPGALRLPPDPTLPALALANIWGMVGLMGVAEQPLLGAAQWAWSSYERSHTLLEEARDRQAQLKQIMQDLTDANNQLARLNQFARDMREAAEDARRAKERFVANVSHELRTPLNMIVGFSELITSSPESYGAGLPQALLADLQVILRNGRHLAGLIDDVLDLSQIEAGRMAVTKERVDLAEVVEAAMVAVRQLFDSKGLYLESALAPDIPPILCDATRIREVILNLLSNAARFTDQGGVRLSVSSTTNDITVAVADTGPGIAREQITRLFRPFEQLDASLRRRHGGSGLGLSISKGFVELHGGTMWIESTPGHGTTIFFRLPIDAPPPLQDGVVHWLRPEWEYKQRTRPSTLRPAVVHPRLVVLEKGDALQRLLARYLDGLDVVSAASLSEAGQKLAESPSQALIMNDVLVGQALHDVINSGALPSGTPAIICSLPEASTVAEELGIADYLVKPVARERLLATLDRLGFQGKRILVVDDEPEVLRLFVRMLGSARQGYQVSTAANGEAALRILRKQKPGVVLLDLVMPDMDGFRFLNTVRQDATFKDTPIIVTSARDPVGRSVASSAVAVTKEGGMSPQEVLACVDALRTILAPGSRPGDPALPENRAD